MNIHRQPIRSGRALPLALGLALAAVTDASAQRKPDPRPNLVPASVTNITGSNAFSGYERTADGVSRQRFRICAKNTGLLVAGQPWRMIISYPDDKGGRPNAYYWSAHDVSQSLKNDATYCYERYIWITECRGSNPRIRVSVDTNNAIAESNESADDNRKDFYPKAFCNN